MPKSRTSDNFKNRKDIAPISDTDLFFQTFESELLNMNLLFADAKKMLSGNFIIYSLYLH
jgi:hypothetical protein